MKKRFSQSKYRKHNERRSRRSLARNAAHKRYQKLLNTSQIGVKEVKYRRVFERPSNFNVNRPPIQSSHDRFKDFVPIEAPSDFRFLDNPVGVIHFVTRISDCFEHRTKVFLHLNRVTKIDYCAIAVLYSIMVRFKAKKISFAGNSPLSRRCNETLRRSGFFISLQRDYADQDSYFIVQKGNYVTYGDRSVESDKLGIVLDEAAETVWGKPRRCLEVQTNLVELAQNTEEHASPEDEEKKHGWLSVNHDQRNKRVEFSFVDFGVGIFESLKDKPPEHKFFGSVERLYEKFKFGNNAELLRLILKGELHRSVTGDYHRGQGLPGLLDSLDDGWMRRLYIISNDVFANITEDQYVKLPYNFTGTFVYWELTKDCRSLDPVK